MTRYLVCPGWVRSQTDGDRHYVGVCRLVRLYGLRPGEFLVDDGRPGYAERTDLVRLYPRPDGDYRRPE